MSNEDFVTLTEGARLLNWPRYTLRTLVTSGRVPGAELIEDERGHLWRIPRASLSGLERPKKGWPAGRPKPPAAIAARLATIRRKQRARARQQKPKRRQSNRTRQHSNH